MIIFLKIDFEIQTIIKVIDLTKILSIQLAIFIIKYYQV